MRTSLAFGLAILVGYNHAAPVDDSAAIAAAIAGVYDAPKTSTPATTTSKISQSTVITSAVPTATASEARGCGIVAAASSSYLVANPDTTGVAPIPFAASVAMDCLESVPLDVDRSTAYCDFIEPYFQFQSTLAYLKDPPEGYLLPGVDLLGGLAEIRDNLQTGKYSNQWEFEVDLYTLGNVLHHDFHMNLPLPLVSVFAFVPRNGILVSVSSDGLALPNVYFKSDLNAQFDSNTTADFTPSPIVSVNGQDISTYIQTLAQTMSSFQDPDALWNQVFFSLPANGYNANNLGLSAQGGYMYGFTNDSYTYSFANGTETEVENLAVVNINADFTTILTGQDLFDMVDLPPASETASASDEVTAAPTSSTPAATSAAFSTTTSLVGYPSPVVIQPDGYTSGYFLDNTTIAVLAMQGFIDAEEASPLAPNNQQTAIKEFLTACKEAGMTKLIVDLSTNGGGDVLSGFDAFKQLFPTLLPFGASRLRATPLVNYLGAINSADGYYNDVNNSIYQIQSALDVNDHPFANWQLEDGPYLIHGDNFTAEIRSNFSDPVQDADGNYTVSGFLNNSNIAPQLFQPSDMVMVMDGGCGSTCAVFAELMKSQGGVRTITLGGRPQYGPSQGVGGSKGAQVFTYGDIIQTVATAPNTVADLEQKGFDLSLLPDPNDIPDEYLLDLEDNVPLGTNAALTAGGRINLRNNMHDGDSTSTPLQFIYEPGVCRLFYKAEDIFDFSNVWARVAEVAWGNGKCVQGSTITKNNTIPAGPYDTVPWSSDVVSTIKQDYSPGLLGYANGTGGTSTDVNSTQPTPSSPNSSPTFTAGASLLSFRSAGVFGIFGVLFAVLV